MIKLQRGEKPDYLTDEKVKELTERFKANNKDTVWKHPNIHNALLLSSSSKCAFCEGRLQVGASYMEIEHFKPKDKYPSEVVHWTNLLPSCKRCNTSKSTHDVVDEPIINPFDVDPTEHLAQAGCRVYAKTQLGESTKFVLNLNDMLLTRPRYEVWNYVTDKIEEIYHDFSKKTKLTRHDRNKLSKLLVSCQPDHEYSAFASTALHESNEYLSVAIMLKEHNQWDEQMEFLHNESLKLVLDKRKKA
ncbi:HNH endonuclease family protein [Acinetobacter stercoris]|uniref:HNH nuclease domain-containing protein n=1 Tax=Acinetobacter stercoris TaxID=2126983 RepID=A0A2U3MUP0_9GAMM|nr:hypothetical protein [Acinetobacter stercoris]SPL69141.1 hypothetical protein KPC_0319 [Acinetobacter stercoris]